MLRLYFFFFQAEDGIRDRNVTGVQTCALPICQRSAEVIKRSTRGDGVGQGGQATGQLSRGGIGTGVENALLRGCGRRRARRRASAAAALQVEPPSSPFGTARFGAHRLLEAPAVESGAARVGGDVDVRPVA